MSAKGQGNVHLKGKALSPSEGVIGDRGRSSTNYKKVDTLRNETGDHPGVPGGHKKKGKTHTRWGHVKPGDRGGVEVGCWGARSYVFQPISALEKFSSDRLRRRLRNEDWHGEL